MTLKNVKGSLSRDEMKQVMGAGTRPGGGPSMPMSCFASTKCDSDGSTLACSDMNDSSSCSSEVGKSVTCGGLKYPCPTVTKSVNT